MGHPSRGRDCRECSSFMVALGVDGLFEFEAGRKRAFSDRWWLRSEVLQGLVLEEFSFDFLEYPGEILGNMIQGFAHLADMLWSEVGLLGID